MSHEEIRLLGVIPGTEEATSMWFARRQMATVGAYGVVAHSFFLRSRTSPRMILKEMRRLRNEIQQFRPDVVHAHFGTMTAFVSAIVSPVPLVVTYHGQDLNPSPADPWIRSTIGHALSHLAAKRASQIICVSAPLRQRLANIKDRVHIIPCGINLERFRPMAKDQCRARLGWTMEEKIVVFNAGSDPVRKRIDLAQQTVACAKRVLPGLRLHVFGGNTHPDEMPLYYSAADALLVTSDYEGSPMVVKEALACNLPVVSVDVGDVAQRLAGVVPSAVVARDPIQLGEALVDVIRSDRPSNGREMVRPLSEEAVAAKLASIYRLAAGGSDPGSVADCLDEPVPFRRKRNLRAAS